MDKTVIESFGTHPVPAGMLAWHSAFESPRHIVEDAFLTNEQKREILSGWASDARACADKPTLRRHEKGAVAPLDDILEALRDIDRMQYPPPRRLSSLLPRRSRLLMGEYIRVKRNRRPDDGGDDPPPLPARALPPRPPMDNSDAIRLPETVAA